MAAFAEFRRFGLTLPGAEAFEWLDWQGLRVGKKTFVMWSRERGHAVMKLERDHQTMLFELRPDVFQPFKVGTGVWSAVMPGGLERDETTALVLEAWTQIVPKKISRALKGSRVGQPR